jgi:hypothetical protein
MKKTEHDLQMEIIDAELALIEARGKLDEGPTDPQEEYMRRNRELPADYVSLKVRRERVAVYEKKLDLLKQELLRLQGGGPSSGTNFAPGELKKVIADFAKRDGCKTGATVPSSKINKWINEIEKTGKSTSSGAIRAVLSDLGITKEREA